MIREIKMVQMIKSKNNKFLQENMTKIIFNNTGYKVYSQIYRNLKNVCRKNQNIIYRNKNKSRTIF